MEETHAKVFVKHSSFKKIGHCFAVFVNNKAVIVIGPHWPFMFCVIPLITSVLIGYLFYVAPHMNVFWQFGGTCIIL